MKDRTLAHVFDALLARSPLTPNEVEELRRLSTLLHELEAESVADLAGCCESALTLKRIERR